MNKSLENFGVIPNLDCFKAVKLKCNGSKDAELLLTDYPLVLVVVVGLF